MLPAETLAVAAARAAAFGVGAEKVLIAHGVISEDAYLERLRLRVGVKIADLSRMSREDIPLSDEELRRAAETGVLPITIDGERVLVTCLRGGAARVLARAPSSPRALRNWRVISEAALQDFLLYRTGALIDHAIDGLRAAHPALSAAPRERVAFVRRFIRGAIWAGSASLVALFVVAFSRLAGDLLALLFLAGMMLRLVASLLPARKLPVRRVRDADLPDYSIIVALYREAKVVPQLLAALDALDYPREKLDVLLAVETDDLATRAAIARARPSPCVRVVVAPNEGPRTKPKALNVALPFARGRYVAVFDAEDQPEPDQLRKAIAAFRADRGDLACVQARLSIDNVSDSLISRMFAAEYAGQFNVVMPGYDRLGLPWPLGGTSNHFDAHKLREVGAWDPFNVTEDADLGLRFARFHYRTRTIDSTTWEESTIAFRPWLHQRTRWMKGWMHQSHAKKFCHYFNNLY